MEILSAAVIDVLSPESFAAEHVTGAVNICVYETAFLDNVRAAFPDPGTKLIVYGLDDSTREAQVAAGKLAAAEYRNVEVLPGGLSGWKSRGGEVECLENSKTEEASGSYAIDPATSFVRWTGRNLFSFHTGGVSLGAGQVVVENGGVVGGKLSVDMTSLRCSDLADSALNAMLIGHLRSDDFFSVEEFPTAEFSIASASPLDGATLGRPSFRIRGDFTLRGVTRPLEIPASIAANPGGGFTAQAELDLDRTGWNSVYGSGKFFARLGPHVVNDLVHLHLKIVTVPIASETTP